MTGWHQRRYLALDFETTGVDPETARPVSACIAWVGGDEPTEMRRWLINAGVPIPAEATAVHGVTDEHVRLGGVPAKEAVEGLLGELDIARAEQMPLVVYNAPYDLTLLDREHRRQFGGEPLPFEVRPVIDPLCIDKALDRYRKGKRTLTAACEQYKVTLDEAHASDSDALAAARLAWRLAQVYPADLADLEQLHDKQIAWAAEQAAGLADYFRKLAGQQTDPDEREQLLVKADGVDGSWPLRPYVAATAAEVA